MQITARKLARAYGVQGAYNDINGKRRKASDQQIGAMLAALGVNADNPRRAWDKLARELWSQLAEPVTVAWQGAPATLGLRLRQRRRTSTVELNLHLHRGQGEHRHWTVQTSVLPVVEQADVDGKLYEVRALPLPSDLPMGYHHLHIACGKQQHRSLVIAAPRQAYIGEQPDRRLWGVFAPIYSLRSKSDWGMGDYSQLGRLSEWVAKLGGGIVATLPFCASFMDTLFSPSPYAPVSRLFWNEAFVDPMRAPMATKSLMASSQLPVLRDNPLLDYRALWAHKRGVLEQLCRQFFDAGRDPDFDAFVARRPQVTDYAQFRAATEQFNCPFRDWPEPLRRGHLREQDGAPEVQRFHLFVQWLAERQIAQLASKAREYGPGLYVDLPLGVHDCGYDAWRQQELFVPGLSVGAPPDSLFTGGQNWGFQPLHPQKLRQQHYGHFIDFVGNIMRHAGILRIDHVMGMHRLFCIPAGCETQHGVYLRYAADELYAILTLESHRNRCLIVGENLGTVPNYVNQAMERHGIHGMYVMQYVLGGGALPPIPEASVASLNTHDMPPFAGYWRGLDIDDRRDLELTDNAQQSQEHIERAQLRQRLIEQLRAAPQLNHPRLSELRERINTTEDGDAEQSAAAVRDACFAVLGASEARMVLANLEDLWLETEPQNVPGIGDGRRPVWRRRLRHTLDEIEQDSELKETLAMLKTTRQAPDS